MKIRKIILVGFLFVTFTQIVAAQTQDVNELLARAKEASASLARVKIKGKTITAAVNVTYTEGGIDYAKAEFFAVEKTDAKILNSVYRKNDVTYMYNGIIDSWFKFGKDVQLFDNILDKDKLFSFFPVNPAESGFEIKSLGEETIEGEPCYIIQSEIVDPKLAKEFILSSLEKFVSGQIAKELVKNQDMLSEYLDFYTRHAESTHWISKNSFFVIKTLSKFRQMIGPKESVSVATQVIYYDFNQSLNITVPPVAKAARDVSASDVAFDEDTTGETEDVTVEETIDQKPSLLSEEKMPEEAEKEKSPEEGVKEE